MIIASWIMTAVVAASTVLGLSGWISKSIKRNNSIKKLESMIDECFSNGKGFVTVFTASNAPISNYMIFVNSSVGQLMTGQGEYTRFSKLGQSIVKYYDKRIDELRGYVVKNSMVIPISYDKLQTLGSTNESQVVYMQSSSVGNDLFALNKKFNEMTDDYNNYVDSLDSKNEVDPEVKEIYETKSNALICEIDKLSENVYQNALMAYKEEQKELSMENNEKTLEVFKKLMCY